MSDIFSYDSKKIGKRIKEERDQKNMSQSEFAEYCGLQRTSRGTVGEWENGKRLPDLEALLKMCELFECELGYILCEEGYSCKTRKAADIKAATGLSEDSIISLSHIARDQKIGAITLRFLDDLLDYFELPNLAIAYEQLKDGAHKNQDYTIMDNDGKFVDFLCGDVDLLILQNRFTRFALSSSEALSMKSIRREWAMKTDEEKDDLLAMIEEDLRRGK